MGQNTGDDPIPEDLRRFIILNIDSVAELECLLLFQRNPGWKAAPPDIAQKLYIPVQDAQDILERLVARQLLGQADDNLYAYKNLFAEMVTRLAALYAQYLVPVTNLIHSKPKNKIQKFADAFWIRKD
ncbi:MAG: hypothetical protein JWO78_1464 [Micavibrio sp.]|nr:hypothetical protein [Micavibrio sp.]